MSRVRSRARHVAAAAAARRAAAPFTAPPTAALPPGFERTRGAPAGRRRKEAAPAAHAASLSALVQGYFTQHLQLHRNVSPHTVAAYAEAFRLFFRYQRETRGRTAAQLTLEDFGHDGVLGFLDWLERTRGNAVRTRNARRAALCSFLRYASGCAPEWLGHLQRALQVPTKRYDRRQVSYLSREEMDAVLEAPGRATWSGRRDTLLFGVAYVTGARISELCGMRVADVQQGERGCSIRVMGKGRRARSLQLPRDYARQVRDWIAHEGLGPTAPLFPNRSRAAPLTRSGAAKRLHEAVQRAAAAGHGRHRALGARHVSPHQLRHTFAMHMLQAGVPEAVISLQLGHESPASLSHYVEANTAMKEKALAQLQPRPALRLRYRPKEELLAFLEQL